MNHNHHRVFSSLLLASATLAQGATYRVSMTSISAQANGLSQAPDLSGDGRLVAFSSSATNLAAGDTNGKQDIFVKDLLDARVTRVSVSSAGTQANDHSQGAMIAAGGRFVAYESDATNLVPGDTNTWTDVFVFDRVTGQTSRESVSSAGAQGDYYSLMPAISADGRFVAFSSLASTLVSGDTNMAMDVFLRDRANNRTTRLSQSSAGIQGNGDSGEAAITEDGRFVVFSSTASNLVAGDSNQRGDIFLHEVATGITTRISRGTGGAQPDGDSSRPAISADGRFVAFESSAANLVAGDGNSVRDVFVLDRQNGTTLRASVSTTGGDADQESGRPSLSADGRYLCFESDATNLVARQSWARDVFVRDLVAGTTTLASIDSTGGVAGEQNAAPRIARDGRTVAFQSADDGLTPNDTNHADDIMVHEPLHHMATNDMARPGTLMRFTLRSPRDSGRIYLALAALNTQFGIRLGARLFPLDSDPLLLMSLTPGLWQNGAGALDASGNAQAMLVLPNQPALIGLEINTGYLVLDPAAGVVGMANATFFQIW